MIWAQRTISAINLLLPLNKDSQVTHKIEAQNGCYAWQSSHPYIIEVEQIMNEKGCHNEARIKVKTKEDFKGIVWL